MICKYCGVGCVIVCGGGGDNVNDGLGVSLHTASTIESMLDERGMRAFALSRLNFNMPEKMKEKERMKERMKILSAKKEKIRRYYIVLQLRKRH